MALARIAAVEAAPAGVWEDANVIMFLAVSPRRTSLAKWLQSVLNGPQALRLKPLSPV